MAEPRPVILVHGLWYRAWSMGVLRRRLEKNGLKAHGFSYPTRTRAPQANAARLAAFARGIEDGRVDFVAHSLGGLVLQLMLHSAALPPGGRIVLLGTPLQGSAVARRLGEWRLSGALLGRAEELLRSGGDGWMAGWEVGMIAGSRPVGLGRVTGVLEEPHDGTVAVPETAHPALNARLLLPVTHTGMLASRPVADATARFLANGQFEPER